jgi:PASTA domain-containing protein
MVNILQRIPKPALIGGVVVIGGGGIYLYVRHKNAAAQLTTADATDTSASDLGDTSSDTSSTDSGYIPAGYGYGPDGLSDYGGYDNSGAQDGGYYNAGTSTPVQVQTQATTNAQWVQAAISALTNQGYTGTQVTAALGTYVTGGALTADQVSVVNAAIGVEGYPPVAGANGYPPSIKSQNSAQTGQKSNVTVPNVIGKRADVAFATLRAHNLAPSPGGLAAANIVTVTNPPAGASVAPKSTVKVTAPKKGKAK